MSGITVIYDGDCQLCKNSINWLAKKLSFNALSYQSAPLDQYGLTLTECEKQVYAIFDSRKYAGVSAVIFLLSARGNKVSAFILKASGPIGAAGYKLIAANRQSLFVRGLSRFIKRIT
jgi:predicted DCC family thiol-disulfide oxidoreductase YuxK